MRTALISTLGGGVGRITNYLIRGLTRLNNIDIDLFQVDNRLEFDIPDNIHVKRRYRPSIHESFLAHAESIFDMSVMSMNYDLVHCNYSSNAAY